MLKFGFRQATKKMKLNVFLASENNSNMLAPMLGQYGMKPSDFVLKLKDAFMLLMNENKDNKKFETIDVDFFFKSLVFSFILVVGKNNSYNMILKKFSFSFLYNVFLQSKSGVFFNVLFLYKLSLIYLNKFKILFFLVKKMLSVVANSS